MIQWEGNFGGNWLALGVGWDLHNTLQAVTNEDEEEDIGKIFPRGLS